jgi:exosortase/archaeosortase
LDWSFVLIGIRNVYLINLVMYVLVSVSFNEHIHGRKTLLATVSAFIIYQLSKESQGSGIPEIKAILGGYIMEGFLSSKNLIAKAASLVYYDLLIR